ncbi:MAG: cobalamin-dependent protein [Candidatus Omnitrophica bacterium]|nr:cobalamin-dependent protein [Candidatus Omnitrophota bacterium]
MPKIIFINPPLTLYQRYGFLGGVLGQLQPVSLCYLAAATRKAGFETEIIDAPALGMGVEEVAEKVITRSPKYVGITTTTCSVFNAGMLAKGIKERNHNIIIILGGVHISALPERTMEAFKEIDFGVIGEGEETVVELLHACEKKDDIRNVRGIITREKGAFMISSPSDPISDLDSLPMPAWDLLDDFSYYNPNLSSLHRLPVAALVTSRGCLRRCIFCDNKLVFGNGVRTHSPEYIIEMIKHLRNNYHVKEIVFKDPDFTFSRNRAIKFCRMLKAEKLKITWSCMMRADSADKDILVNMKDAGCWQVGIGIESGSQKILDFLKKDMQLERVEACVDLINKAGLNIISYFMLGAPLDSEDSINATRKFIKKLRIENLKLNFFTPYPGSPIYKDIGNFGNFTEDWARLNGAYPVFIPFGLDPERLQHFSKKILKEFYFRPRIILNYLNRSLDLRIIFRFFSGMMTLIRHILKKND